VSHYIASTQLRRISLTIVLTLTLLWLLSDALTATNAAQAQPNDLIVNPGESIQAAIDAANNGDTIFITAGRYTESLTLSKPVSLMGADRDTTILRAVEGQPVLTVTGATISNSVVISGLTFTGGNADNGGGIYSDAPLTVMNSRFISNTAQQSGGGIFASDAVTLTNVSLPDTF
jgi:predicted outer membrane repeat protein